MTKEMTEDMTDEALAIRDQLWKMVQRIKQLKQDTRLHCTEEESEFLDDAAACASQAHGLLADFAVLTK